MTHDELKSAREDRGFTQSKMAELLGVPVSTYRKWEYGHRKIPGPVANQLVGKTLEVKHLSTAQAMEFAKKCHRLGLDPDEVTAKLMLKWMGEASVILLACLFGFYAMRAEKAESAVLSSAVVSTPAAKKQQPEPDDE